jgi:BolA protein
MTTSRAQQIEHRLRDQLQAVHVDVVDDSALHAGHLGAEGGGGHFRVLVVSTRFVGVSRVAAQRIVYGALADLMMRDIHALQMQTMTPAEWKEGETGNGKR